MRICAGFSVAATSSCSRVCRPHHTPFTEPPASRISSLSEVLSSVYPSSASAGSMLSFTVALRSDLAVLRPENPSRSRRLTNKSARRSNSASLLPMTTLCGRSIVRPVSRTFTGLGMMPVWAWTRSCRRMPARSSKVANAIRFIAMGFFDLGFISVVSGVIPTPGMKWRIRRRGPGTFSAGCGCRPCDG